MIVGLGLDVVELDRVRKAFFRHGTRFSKRILHPNELKTMPKDPIPYLAARFAAKEAGAKALGTGFSQGVGFHGFEIVPTSAGKPELLLHGAARVAGNALGVTAARVSLTHGRDVAAAVVILEALSDRPGIAPEN